MSALTTLLFVWKQIPSLIFKNNTVVLNFNLIYDVCHNIAKIEEHNIDGKNKKVCVHRKGATRAFPGNYLSLPESFRETGQPVLIPGDMGRYSFIAAGTGKRLESGEIIPLDVKVGDTVLFGKYSGTEVKVNGDDLLVMREDDIMGVIEA